VRVHSSERLYDMPRIVGWLLRRPMPKYARPGIDWYLHDFLVNACRPEDVNLIEAWLRLWLDGENDTISLMAENELKELIASYVDESTGWRFLDEFIFAVELGHHWVADRDPQYILEDSAVRHLLADRLKSLHELLTDLAVALDADADESVK
jgi:hypothetical protein